ncbi:MAG: nitrilase-related carbon-nitrogen hydrolase [Burkholderiaceae bacterium]
MRARVDSVSLWLWFGAIVAGVALGFGAAFPSAWPLSWLAAGSLTGLIIAQTRRSSGQGLALVLLSWAAWQLGGTGWVALAVRDGQHAVAWRVAVLAVLLWFQVLPVLGTWLVLGWFARRAGPAFERDPWQLMLRYGLTLACAETLRQSGWWGSGYASLGAAFLDVPGAKLVIPVLGSAGWGLVVWASAALSALVVWFHLGGGGRAMVGTAVALAVVVAGLGALGWRETGPLPAWTQARPDTPVHAMVVQPPGEWTKSWTVKTRDEAVALLKKALAAAPREAVVVTAETYFPEPPPQRPEGVWLDVVNRAHASRAHLLVGMPHLLRDTDGVHMMNSVVQLSPNRQSLYAKERLVPGGEYLPWSGLLGPVYAQAFDNVRTGQRAGPAELMAPMFVAGETVGVSICHELSFTATMVDRAREANWLVNLADDVWIDEDLYRRQMLGVARLRALESGKPVLRVSQGAPSVLVLPDGSVAAQAPDAGAQLLPVQFSPYDGRTPYHRYFDILACVPLALAALWCVGALVRRLAQPQPAELT